MVSDSVVSMEVARALGLNIDQVNAVLDLFRLYKRRHKKNLKED